MTLLPILTTFDYGVVGAGTYGTAAWPLTDKIIYSPIRVYEDFTVLRVCWQNGGTVNGNANLGLYDSTGAKLWETGSTGQSGANGPQFVNITDQPHSAGVYYIAMQHSNTTGTYGRINIATNYFTGQNGILMENAGSFALPSTATWTTMTTAYIPIVGLDLRG